MRIAGGAIASATLLCSPSVQAENPGALKTSELPRAWTSEEADALAAHSKKVAALVKVSKGKGAGQFGAC